MGLNVINVIPIKLSFNEHFPVILSFFIARFALSSVFAKYAGGVSFMYTLRVTSSSVLNSKESG